MDKIRIKTLRDIEKIEELPLEKRFSISSTYNLLKQGAMINPDGLAISFLLSGDQYDAPIEITYRDFWAYINRTANLLYDMGIGPGDVVSYLLPNLPQTHYFLWGGEAAGIINPINPMLEPSTIRDICCSAGTRVLVALGEYPGSDIWDKVEKIRKDLPDLKYIIRIMGPSNEKEGIYGYDEVIDRYEPDKLNSGRVIESHEIASLYHTGGTTGTPKLAPRSHFNEAATSVLLGLCTDLNTGEGIMCGLPLFHCNGTIGTGSFPFSIGAHVILLSPSGYREPSIMQHFYKIVEHYKAVTLSFVPTVMSVLMEIPKGDADISSLRYALCGAAPLSVELFKRFEDYTGLKILEGYGLTEGTVVSSINPLHGERKIGSIGLRLPYQDMKILITEGDEIREAATDEIGSICVKGPNVFNGYLEDKHNVNIWPEEGWFNTGDLGRCDADGYFWITGRKKELIIRGGHNIDPALIEDPLYRLPGVQVAAAVGRPDTHAGEVPVVFVQKQPDADLTAEKILDHLKTEVGERAAIPKEVIFIDNIPLTPIGKIFKPALRHSVIERVYRSELKVIGDMVDSIDVAVSEHPLHGVMATLQIKPASNASQIEIKNKVDDILAGYTIRYNIEFM